MSTRERRIETEKERCWRRQGEQRKPPSLVCQNIIAPRRGGPARSTAPATTMRLRQRARRERERSGGHSVDGKEEEQQQGRRKDLLEFFSSEFLSFVGERKSVDRKFLAPSPSKSFFFFYPFVSTKASMQRSSATATPSRMVSSPMTATSMSRAARRRGGVSVAAAKGSRDGPAKKNVSLIFFSSASFYSPQLRALLS